MSCAEVIAATFVGGQTIGGYAQDGIFDRRTGVGMGLLGPRSDPARARTATCGCWCSETGQWRSLVRAMGDPEWAQLDMFDDLQVRGQNKDLIYPLVQEWTMQYGKFEIMERCQAEGAPVTAIFTVEEAAEHPHLHERGYFVDVEHPTWACSPTSERPSSSPPARADPRRHAPLLAAQ